MTDATANPEDVEPKKKSSKLPMLLGLVLALAGGGGGFYAAYSGLLPGGVEDTADGTNSAEVPEALPTITFVPIDPLVVTLASPGVSRHLRFEAQLEIAPGEDETVRSLMPRILDVLNGYLRAVRVEDLERPTALLTIRAHMLRRVQIVVGHGRVHDLLVTEFVLN